VSDAGSPPQEMADRSTQVPDTRPTRSGCLRCARGRRANREGCRHVSPVRHTPLLRPETAPARRPRRAGYDSRLLRKPMRAGSSAMARRRLRTAAQMSPWLVSAHTESCRERPQIPDPGATLRGSTPAPPDRGGHAEIAMKARDTGLQRDSAAIAGCPASSRLPAPSRHCEKKVELGERSFNVQSLHDHPRGFVEQVLVPQGHGTAGRTPARSRA